MLTGPGRGLSVDEERLSGIFKKRRQINMARLRKLDMLISQSSRAEAIYRDFLGDDVHAVTLHSPVKHLDLIKPKKIDEVRPPVRFATLNGCSSIPKGALLISEALDILEKKKRDKDFQFHIYGSLEESVAKKILRHKNVFCHGRYELYQLDGILQGVDVGIVPSVWEEIYGYVGIEFLTKGIPIIGNDRGGICDYTIDGFTGWLNKSSSAQELAAIMDEIIRSPAKVIELNRKILGGKGKLIKTMEDYFADIDKVYKTLVSR